MFLIMECGINNTFKRPFPIQPNRWVRKGFKYWKKNIPKQMESPKIMDQQCMSMEISWQLKNGICKKHMPLWCSGWHADYESVGLGSVPCQGSYWPTNPAVHPSYLGWMIIGSLRNPEAGKLVTWIPHWSSCPAVASSYPQQAQGWRWALWACIAMYMIPTLSIVPKQRKLQASSVAIPFRQGFMKGKGFVDRQIEHFYFT